MSYSVAVAGASGYAGGELLRLLAAHPQFEVRTVTAHQNAGEPLRRVHPHLASYGDTVLAPTTADSLRGHEIVFLALPHGHSGAIAEQLGGDALLVDCGADHRLESAQDWADYYGGDHYGSWTYGMPELPLADGGRQRAALGGVRRIAVPGCNVTAVTFALAPAITRALVEPRDLTAVLAVGPSGAGKKASVDLLGSELIGSANPYAVDGGHRHNPEIRQNLRRAGGTEVALTFTPVIVPMSRGILATTSARLREGVSLADVRAAFDEVYADERFIDLLPAGVWPRSGDVTGSNRAAIGVGVDERAGRLVAVSAIDNLGKGTAGAAIQSANLALGLDESLGLPLDGVAP
ncbi:N-acetyl-gamma-glutamyl-phosphate reductase [Pseudoclavibacter chungangensis]|uniref:N-acetyl-gamma-glutamyl-phosphate reductase n=1 Tax=Pseudoclavibacter chungangensis TaxID=587635 RepID=A0A7J5BN07_9MICO|nr:N-acetyl-gamma-glutamyl-phosphate reductase [Pseudoclavibacter chungangensis]KAB1653126.1 N-acetyl-gamma-glutamyl-phosphate reductase [Pseudoclavibacter chungangensis]NYJ66985.1 N-acetyl-gamma-glutamyl-phosphate reductase [Pseudoclavibacter chungangensis]